MLIPVFEWIIPFAMAPVVAYRHAPTASIAWLVFIFFKPWLGLLLYLLVGTNWVVRRLTKTYCQRLREIRSLHKLSIQEPDLFQLPAGSHRLELAEITRRLVCMPIMRGNTVELLDDGYQVIDRMISDIGAAQHHVHLLFYIFADDEVGRRIAGALAAASARGVRCRLVVDAFGSRSLRHSLGAWLTDHGVELHELMPINPFRRHLTRLDLRNHRKLVIVDGKVAYTGSQNIEKKDYDHRRASAWHDLMVRLVGPVVLQLQLVFLEDWYLGSDTLIEGADIFPLPTVTNGIPVQSVPSGPIDPTAAIRDLLIAAIYGARRRVIITSPYFIPDEPFLLALYVASLRGVVVDLIIPRHTDHPVVGAVARAYFDSLIEAGARIHFHAGMLHAKTMSVDTTLALIGTANFDRRSFHLHSELSLLLYGPEITARLRTKQEEYMRQSQALDVERWRNRSKLKQVRDKVLKTLSPLL